MKNGVYELIKDAFATLTGANRFSKEDALLLKTSLMLAAVDGEVSEDEIARFKAYAEKCRGYNEVSFDELWDKAVRSAGYLLLQSRFLAKDELIAAFVKEAEVDFVGKFILTSDDERERAFAFLERMAKSDGDFSEIERAAIASLFAAVKTAREQHLAERYSRGSIYGK